MPDFLHPRLTINNRPPRQWQRGAGDLVALPAEVYEFLARGRHTGGAYALMEITVEPGGGPGMHVHIEVEESFTILEGELTFTYEGETIHAPAGSFVNLPRGSVHGFKNNGTVPARIRTLIVPAGLNDYFTEAGNVITDPAAARPLPPTRENIQRLLDLGPKYNLHFHEE